MNHLRTVALVMLAGLIVIPAGQSSAQVEEVERAERVMAMACQRLAEQTPHLLAYAPQCAGRVVEPTPPPRDPTRGLRYYEGAEPVTTFSDGSKQINSLTYKEALEAQERAKIQKQCSKVKADGSNASIGTYNACAGFYGR